MILCDVIADEDFRHSMRFSKGPVSGFYGKTPENEELIAQRCRWLEEEPNRHALILDECEPLLNETVAVASDAEGVTEGAIERIANAIEPGEKCRLLGEAWEPDFLLMKFTPDGLPRLLGGCVCFPSHWSLAEKMGKSMDAIHSPVPRLNRDLDRQINGFLGRIKPGISWERSNWGLAATPELNLHPDRDPLHLRSGVTARDVWLRIEWQSLVALPESSGILFGIRLEIVPLTTVMEDVEATRRLRRALVTMPPEMARYKDLAECRESLIALLAP